MRRAVAFALVLSTLGLVAAGCGSGSGNSDKKANQTYATGVCEAINTWATQVKSLATVPTGGITKASLDTKLSQFETATKTLVTEIKAVPPPNTSEGQAARKQIDKLASQVQATSVAVKSASSSLPANATLPEMLSELSRLVPQFRTLQSTAQSTVKTIKSAGGSLASAFNSEQACRKIG